MADLPYFIPPKINTKPLKPPTAPLEIHGWPGITPPELTMVAQGCLASDPNHPQEWELAQGYARAMMKLYNVTYTPGL